MKNNLKNDLVIRKKCVLCKSKNLKRVLNFGKTPLANSYIRKLKVKEKHFPLACILCLDCKHLQLQHLIKPRILFENYMYVSGTSPVFVKHFENFFRKIKKTLKLDKSNDKILDIACNDGSFLNFFKKDNFKHVVGIEPAKNLRHLNTSKKIDVNTIFFNYKNSFFLKEKYKEFKVITANNVFAHVPDLQDFSLGVKNILSKDGLFIFEVSYLKDVMKKLTFDTIYHEHMSYHALKPLIDFFDKIEMKVVDFDLIEPQGGSIRVYVGHKNIKAKTSKIKNQIKIETKFGLFKIKSYLNFYDKINNQKNKISNLINNNIRKGKTFIGYGAPAKVTTFCHVLNLGNKEIKFIIDDNKLKQNKYTPGKNIKILDFKKIEKIKFHYIIILAWNFAKPIIHKLKKKNKRKKFKIIVPFPKLKIF